MREYTVKYEESPVRLLQPIEKDWEYIEELDENIFIKETFPKTDKDGKYSLEIYKKVNDYIQLEEAKNQIIPILYELASVWHFAGGSKILKTKYYTKEELKYSDNFNEINNEFMEKVSSSRLCNSVGLTFSAASTYKCLPLKNALEIFDLIQTNSFCKLLIDFYNKADNDPIAWYVHLYKIKEVLHLNFGNIDPNGKKVKYDTVLKDSLDLNEDEINYFGEHLNNRQDTRHFKIDKPNIVEEEKDRLFKITYSWIQKFIEKMIDRNLF